MFVKSSLSTIHWFFVPPYSTFSPSQNINFETCMCIVLELLFKGNNLTHKSVLSIKEISTNQRLFITWGKSLSKSYQSGVITYHQKIIPIRGMPIRGHVISGSSVDLRFIVTDFIVWGRFPQEPSFFQGTPTVAED